MKSTARLSWRSNIDARWLLPTLGMLVGLLAAILSPRASTVSVVVVLLGGVVLWIYLALAKGIIKAALLFILVWYFVTETVTGSRYFYVDWSFSQLILRVQGAVAGLALVLIAGHDMLSRRYRWHKRLLAHELWLVIFLAMGLWSAVVGLVRGNDLVYLTGDTFKYAFFPLAYFTVVSVLRTAQSRIWMFRTLVTLGLAYNVVNLLMQLFNFLVLSKATLGQGIDLLSWIYLPLVLGHWKALGHGKSRRWWYILLAVLVFLGAIVSLERRDWLFVLLSFLGFAWLTRKKLRAMVVVAIVLSIVIVLSTVFALAFSEQVGTVWDLIARRLEFTFGVEGRVDPSVNTRFIEMQTASDYAIRSGSVLNLVIGMGSGAEYYSPVPYQERIGVPRTGFRHSIHNTYFSVLFRMGVVAPVVLVLFLISLISRIYRHLRAVRRDITADPRQMERFLLTATLFLFLVITAVVEWNVAYGIGNIQVGIALGLVGAELRDRKPERSLSSSSAVRMEAEGSR